MQTIGFSILRLINCRRIIFLFILQMIIESSKPIRVNADCLRAIVSFFDHDDPLTIVRFSRTCRAAKMIGDQLFPKFKQMELRVK